MPNGWKSFGAKGLLQVRDDSVDTSISFHPMLHMRVRGAVNFGMSALAGRTCVRKKLRKATSSPWARYPSKQQEGIPNMPTIIRPYRTVVYRIVQYPYREKIIRPPLTWGQKHPMVAATLAFAVSFGIYYIFWV